MPAIYDSTTDAALLEIEARIHDLKIALPDLSPRQKSELWKELGPIIRDLQAVENATLEEPR